MPSDSGTGIHGDDDDTDDPFGLVCYNKTVALQEPWQCRHSIILKVSEKDGGGVLFFYEWTSELKC